MLAIAGPILRPQCSGGTSVSIRSPACPAQQYRTGCRCRGCRNHRTRMPEVLVHEDTEVRAYADGTATPPGCPTHYKTIASKYSWLPAPDPADPQDAAEEPFLQHPKHLAQLSDLPQRSVRCMSPTNVEPGGGGSYCRVVAHLSLRWQ